MRRGGGGGGGSSKGVMKRGLSQPVRKEAVQVKARGVQLQADRLRTIKGKVGQLLKRVTLAYVKTATTERTEKGVDGSISKI